jgi:hypothetical protein
MSWRRPTIFILILIAVSLSTVGSAQARTRCQDWTIDALTRIRDEAANENVREIAAAIIAEKQSCRTALNQFARWADSPNETSPPFRVSKGELEAIGLTFASEASSTQPKSWFARQLHDLTHPWDAAIKEQKNYFTALPYLLGISLIWAGILWIKERLRAARESRSAKRDRSPTEQV